MNAICRWMFVAGAATFVSSCSPPEIQMVVTEVGSRLRVTLVQDWGIIFSRRQTPCVREAGLYPSGADARNSAVWLIEAQGNVQCLDLASFTIGDTPKGFKQIVALSGVRKQTYSLQVRGIGGGATEVRL